MSESRKAPLRGSVTWESEGTEGGKFHSRKLHVPSGSSGATIGRGYDMKLKSSSKVKADLMAAGLDQETAAKLSVCAGKSGDAAKKFITDNKLDSIEISEEVQVKLFEISYLAEEAEVRRITQKPDVQKKYGKASWTDIHPSVKQILVDLKFRGDYTPNSRVLIQKAVMDNDLRELKRILSNKKYWPNVPTDRFQRRVNYVNSIPEVVYKLPKPA